MIGILFAWVLTMIGQGLEFITNSNITRPDDSAGAAGIKVWEICRTACDMGQLVIRGAGVKAY